MVSAQVIRDIETNVLGCGRSGPVDLQWHRGWLGDLRDQFICCHSMVTATNGRIARGWLGDLVLSYLARGI